MGFSGFLGSLVPSWPLRRRMIDLAGAIEHGMDLRWFIKPGMEEQTLLAAVRFSDYACVGRGIGRGVHGGAIETCLDEATAECAKTKLFPLATTAKIEFKISKPVEANVTYRVFCRVSKESMKGAMYEVTGEITDAKDESVRFALCTAQMANGPFFARKGGVGGPK